MKNKKFCIKIRAWVWEYSDENFEKSKLQKEIKKLLTSLDEYAILNKLSREELLHNSKERNKKVVYNMFAKGYPQEEISEILNLPFSKVKKWCKNFSKDAAVEMA